MEPGILGWQVGVLENRWWDTQWQVHCIKQGTQSWCSGTTQRDGVGREPGRGVQDGGRMYARGWFISMYGKNHHNIVK